MRLPFLLPLVVLLLGIHTLEAKPRFNGSVGYQLVNNSTAVQVNVGLIENTSKTATTGTPQVSVWATTTLYAGGDIRGTKIATFNLGQLKGGQYYRDLKKTVAYKWPPTKGTYFITVTLAEFANGGYGIVDYRCMTKAVTLEPIKPFTLTGPFRWESHPADGTLSIEVAKISHHRPGTTGTLKVAVWATEQPYRGGNLSGYQLGFFTKTGLKPGFSYSDLSVTTSYKAPPPATYSIVYVLSEYRADGYVIVDYYTSANWSTF